MGRKSISRKSLRKKVWDLQSIYVRKKGKGKCVTCGTKKHWKEQQAGHFIHGDSLDFDLRNIHCQCVRCNHWLSGNLTEYTLFMLDKYGRKVIDELRVLKNQVKKFSRKELEELVAYYEEKL